jgi:lactate dehydrogenase-like 2-hydroxyacid dehydrogenase
MRIYVVSKDALAPEICDAWHLPIPDDVQFLVDPPFHDDDRMVNLLNYADVVACFDENLRLQAAVLERLPGMQLLVTRDPTPPGLDVDALQALGVTVCALNMAGSTDTASLHDQARRATLAFKTGDLAGGHRWLT